jgi:DNA polymerase III subunit delta'
VGGGVGQTRLVSTTALGDAFAGVIGQPGVVAQLRAAATAPVHAYLLLGDPGAGSSAAALAFGAALLCPKGGCGQCRDCRLALAGEHPDLLTYVPEGAFLNKDDATEIIRLAMRSPNEGSRKVLVLTEMHRVQVAGPMLLKTIEEPPESTVFVVLADFVPPELVTIASRCVRIDVPALTVDVIEETLLAEGVEPSVAVGAARASAGSLSRARLLASDPELAERRSQWDLVPRRLDGTGAAVSVVISELLDAVERAADALVQKQAAEVAELEERVATYGERGSGRKDLIARHKREQRRHRAAELRFGLATLATRYRTALDERTASPTDVIAAVAAIDAATEAMARNPNETLLLQALFLQLPPLAS